MCACELSRASVEAEARTHVVASRNVQGGKGSGMDRSVVVW